MLNHAVLDRRIYMIGIFSTVVLFFGIGSIQFVGAQSAEDAFYTGKLWVSTQPEAVANVRSNGKVVELTDFTSLVGQAIADEYGIHEVRRPYYFAQSRALAAIYEVHFLEEAMYAEFIDDLEKLPFVQYAEQVPVMRPTLLPNDIGPATGNGNQYGLYAINAPAAWDITTGSTDIKVAIVDDAVLVTHPDLIPNLVPGYDVSFDNDNPMPNLAAMTHGTHVAGIVGAATNNNVGVASIGFNIKIMPVKSSSEAQFVTDAYAGVVWAADNGAHVINMSWGGSGFSQTGQNIINYAYSRGCVNVAAAGNDNVSSVFYPAGYANVISVASTTAGDGKSGFSNFGTWIDVAAPGSNILSTYHNAFQPSYSSISGTSMASPMVAGLAGLVLSVNPELPQAQVMDCIINTADNIDAINPSFAGLLGSGRINAYEAVLCAQATLTAPPVAFVSVQNNVVCPGNVVHFFGSSTGGLATGYQWSFPGGNPATSSVQNPSIVYSIPGVYDVELSVNNDFGDNTTTFSSMVEVGQNGIDIFFTADFEGPDLSSLGWAVENPNGGITWQSFNVSGSVGGNRAAGINLFSYSAIGARDGLVSPSIDFTGHTNIVLDFQHAHRRRSAAIRDSLIVYVSTDNGLTYPHRVLATAENGQGSFATGTILNQQFTPANGNDWCFGGEVGSGCLSVDLSAFDGEPNVRIKFESYNAGGNNIFIDNVQLSGNCLPNELAPVAALQASSPGACVGGSVQFFDASANVPTTYLWTFEGGTPATSTEALPLVTYAESGTYSVSLAVGNSFGDDNIVLENFVTISEAPIVEVSASSHVLCAGESVNLLAAGAENYTWSPIAGLSQAEGASIQASPVNSQTYTVSGSVNGCSAQATVSLEVLPAVPVPVYLTGNQQTFTVLAPTSVQGYYAFSPPAAGWGSPQLANVSVEAPLRIGRDNTVPDSLMCSGVGVLGSLTGHIALIYRGGCEFGTKVFNAQQAGASGVIVVNNVPNEIFNMAPGTFGSSVNIPVMMVSAETGAHLNAAINQGDAIGVMGRFNGRGPGICPGGTMRIAVQGGQPLYTWNNGHEGAVIQIDAPGIYEVEMGNEACSAVGSSIVVGQFPDNTPLVDANTAGFLNVTNEEAFVSYQWLLNGEPIAGAVSSTIVAPEPGVYTVLGTDGNGCTQESDPFDFVLSSASANEGTSSLLLFPNPTADRLQLLLPKGTMGAQLSIADVHGRVVYQTVVDQAEMHEVNVQQLVAGAYVVILRTAGLQWQERFIKVN